MSNEEYEKLRAEVREQLAKDHNWAQQEAHWKANQEHWIENQRFWKANEWHWKIISVIAVLAIVANFAAKVWGK